LAHRPDTDEQLQEINRKQGPVSWPETLEAGRSVDEFLWKGDPKATPVQRVGLAIFAVMFLCLFVLSIVVMIVGHDAPTIVIGGLLGTLTGIAGFRLLRNVFRRKADRSRSR
jgi:hypothetical protein